MAIPSDESGAFRRAMRDLIALSALPAVWVGYQPRQVAEALAEVLLSTLRLDLVYLRLPGQTNGQEIEVARTAGGSTPTDQTRGIGRALVPWLDGAGIDPAPTLPNPAGPGTVRVVAVPIGYGQQDGVLVAGSQQAAFPSEADHLLLTVGANQAAAVLQRQRAEEALRESEERFRSLLLGLPAAVYTTDRQGRITLFNDQAAGLWGRRPDVGKDLWCGSWRIFQPEGTPVPHDQSPLAVALRGGHSRLFQEVIIERPDGRRVWVLAHPRPLRDASGEIVGAVNVLVDITERKQAEEALRASNERFRIVTKATNDAVWDWDLGTDKVWWNEGVLTLFGYRLETNEADPEWWLERVHPDDRAAVEKYFFEVVRGKGLTWVDEYRFRCADGSYKDVYDRGYVIRDAEGRAVRMIGAMLDITARKRAEEALQESEARTRAILETAVDAVITIDERGTVESVNPATEGLFGYPAAELVGRNVKVLMPPPYREGHDAYLHNYLSTGQKKIIGVGREVVGRRKDGTTFPMDLAVSEVRLGDRRLFTGIARDVSERKRAEEALRQSERRFRTLAEALPSMVWTAEPDGTIDYLNSRTVEYAGLTLEQLRGRERWSALHPEDRQRCIEQWMRSVATGEPYEIEYRHRRADGAFRWHLGRALPLRDGSGRITKWFGSIIDIDDQKRAAEALRQAKEAAEAANRAKDEFLANVSHEIRTPMNAILGMTDLALDTPLTEDQREYLKTVKSAADSLLGIINDLLDFAKIEAGKLELDRGAFSLRAVVSDTLRALALRAHKKGLELIYDVQPDVPDALVGDAVRLRQVLVNLVGNALKFTEHGEVVVRVEAAGGPAPEGEAGLRFTVRDTGIGIPQEKQESIFRAFEQEDASTTRRYGGTGLGLTIAARLVALMGGKITVESAPGRGSTFAFTARFGLQPHPPEPAAARPPVLLRGLRVLVVDDNATNRHILEEWLRGWQMEAEAVGDGLAALNALWRAASLGRPYALVLLDARMPDVGGLALAAQIREQPQLSAARLILLTSGDRPGDWERIRELRIDAHLLKPVQPDELLEAIYRVMSRADGPAPPAAAPAGGREPPPAPVPAAAPLRVLVAEDNEFNAQLLEQLLVRRGHRVRLASDGRQALDLAEGGGFDLLLLDIHMPELDGFQVIQAVREREQATGGHLPVIALTARSRKEDRERCLAAGMDDFLAKPVQAADLWAAIDRAVAARPPADPPGPGLLDPRVLLAACGGDAAILGKICQAFRAGLPDHLKALQDALRDRDAPRLREAAHKLSGMVAAFSTVAGGVASELEDHAAQGLLEEARPLAARLETMAEELMRLVGGLSLDALRGQAGTAAEPGRTAGP